jgi:hypothetical protein
MPASIRLSLIGCLGAALLLFAAGPAPAETWRMTLTGNSAINAPAASPQLIVTEVKGKLEPGLWSFGPAGSAEKDFNDTNVFEVFHDAGKTFVVFPLVKISEGSSLSYTVAPRRGEKPAVFGSGIQGSEVPVSLGRSRFTTYRAEAGPKPYYFPVNGPNGKPFTRAYPMEKVEGEDKDHPHQRSLWFTHGNVNGYDFWASDPLNKPNPRFGSIKETSRTLVANGSNVGVLRTTDDWLGSGGKKVCEDERTVLFSGTDSLRIIDFDITIKATAGPVTFGDTKEGMFGLRVPSSMDVKRKQGGKITNAEGITDNDAWGKPSPWVDYTGPVDGNTVGIAILNHPESFRYPTTWHVRDYGLFAANPFGWHDFGMNKSGEYTIPSGESIRFRYRVLLHPGDTTSANMPSAFNAFAKPPTITVSLE